MSGLISRFSLLPVLCAAAMASTAFALSVSSTGTGAAVSQSAPVQLTPSGVPQTVPLSLDLSGLSFSNRVATLPAVTGGEGSGAISFAVTGPCTTDGVSLTATGTGICSVTATKAGDGAYQPLSATTTYTIVTADYQIAQAALVFDISSLSFSNQTASLTAVTGGSGSGAVTYSGNANCSVSGTTVTALAIGSCQITATKAGDSGYLAASTSSTFTLAASHFPSSPPAIAISGGATAAYSNSQGGAGVTRPLSVTGGVPPFEWRILYSNNGGGSSSWISIPTNTLQVTLNQTENQACSSGSVASFQLTLDADDHRSASVNMSWSTLNSKNPGCVQIWQGFQARDSVGSTTGAKWYNLIDPD